MKPTIKHGQMERKILPITNVKMRTDGNGGFEGYGAVFNNVDSYGDVILPGAFKNTLKQFLVNGFASFGHAWSDLPIATYVEAKEDDHGLFVVGEFHSDDFSQRVRSVMGERIERGKSVGESIGFGIRPDGAVISTDSDGFPVGLRLLRDLDLFEVSLVNVPANPEALATAVKSSAVCDSPTCGCRLGMSHHHGVKFVEHGELLLVEVRGFVERAKSHADLRSRSGRGVSEDQQERVTALAAELRDCLTLVEGLSVVQDPEDKGDEIAQAALAEAARFEALRAKDLCVGVEQ